MAPSAGLFRERLRVPARLRPVIPQLPLAATALFAVGWAIARASVQSVTIDEAVSYVIFVAQSPLFVWWPSANNHVLNSMLMLAFTTLFGPSHITVRAGALVGAVVYISACYLLCRLVSRGLLLEWALFVSLVYNPFIFDYLVAARGYGLATAFLMCGIAIPAYRQFHSYGGDGRAISPIRAGILCSSCLALSFAANFSFAFVDAATLVVVFLWTWRIGAGADVRGEGGFPARLLAAFTLPGLAITLVLAAPALLRWPKGQLVYGATSLGETFRTIGEASLYRLDPQFLNPYLYRAMSELKPALFPLLVGISLIQLVFHLVDGSWRRDGYAKSLGILGGALAGIVGLTVAAHWTSFRLFHLLLPKDRTAMYFVPLGTMIAGVIAASPVRRRIGQVGRRGLIAMLVVTGCYFLFCLRLTYFKEWVWDADMKRVYDVLAYYDHAYCADDVEASWLYSSSLNFYRKLSGRERFTEFMGSNVPRPGKQIYVLHGVLDRAFVAAQRLRVVYRGSSEVVVAIRPGLVPARGCRSGGGR